jgi:hypothetical protein
MGLNDRAKPMSRGGRGGAAPKTTKEAGIVRRQKRSPRSNKWSKRSNRYVNNGAVNVDDSRADGINKG